MSKKILSCEEFCEKFDLKFCGFSYGDYFAPMAILAFMQEKSSLLETDEMIEWFDLLSSEAKKLLLFRMFTNERYSGNFGYWSVDMKIAIVKSLMK